MEIGKLRIGKYYQVKKETKCYCMKLVKIEKDCFVFENRWNNIFYVEDENKIIKECCPRGKKAKTEHSDKSDALEEILKDKRIMYFAEKYSFGSIGILLHFKYCTKINNGKLNIEDFLSRNASFLTNKEQVKIMLEEAVSFGL